MSNCRKLAFILSLSTFIKMKKAIIIGATSGIGKSLAELLLSEGYEVGVTGRREELFQSIKTQETSRIVFKKMDVQDLSTLELICNELVSQMGGLDLLIISAGIGEENKNLIFDIDHNLKNFEHILLQLEIKVRLILINFLL